MKILLTNIGRRKYFIDFLIDIKKKYLKKLEVHISDRTNLIASFHTNRNVKTHITPKAFQNSEQYFKSILSIVKKNKIKILIPLTDYDLKILSLKKDLLKKHGCTAIISDLSVIKICESKINTNEFLKKNKLTYPKTWDSPNKFNHKYPAIVKNIYGSASTEQITIHNQKELKIQNFKKKIIQKIIKGNEYNIDILNDLNGNYIDSCIKIKILMRSGETDKARIVKNSKLIKIAKKVSKELRHIGNLDCDLIIDKKGNANILDFNPRFGGAYPFTHTAGKNYLYKIIKMVLKQPYKISRSHKAITGMKGIDIQWFA